MADADSTDYKPDILQKLDALFANFWLKLEGRSQPLTPQQTSGHLCMQLPPTPNTMQGKSTRLASTWRRIKPHKRPQHKRVKSHVRSHREHPWWWETTLGHRRRQRAAPQLLTQRRPA
ncbi:Hypothetical predicted protein, partial [Pelobates cultripes]